MRRTKPSQESIYKSINEAFSGALRIVKFFIYPITAIFLIIFFIWGIDIYNFSHDVKNIKADLNLKIREINVAQKEAKLISDESLKELKNKLLEVDSALQKSNRELALLKGNTKNLNDFSKSIKNSTKEAITNYKIAQNKYAGEIKYASKGADQRKKDIEEIFQKSKLLLVSIADIIENTNSYIEEKVKGTIVDDSYNAEKVKALNKKLKKQLEALRRNLNEK